MASIWLFPPCFNTLWIYTALKLISGKVAILHRFNTLWIYTALKLSFSLICSLPCFNTLWIYTALKRRASTSNGFLVSIPSEFTLLSNKRHGKKPPIGFQYPLNLHCSQTLFRPCYRRFFVSIPSEFTLLSNPKRIKGGVILVSIPSEFTLLSNQSMGKDYMEQVSIPSEFTLLSNKSAIWTYRARFQYPLNLHCSQTYRDFKWCD